MCCSSWIRLFAFFSGVTFSVPSSENISAFGSISGLNQFYKGQNDEKLFFDTSKNSFYQTKPWGLVLTLDQSTLNLLLHGNLKLERTIKGTGMHREVTTTFKVEKLSEQITTDCYVMFSENISQSFSIDVYEMERNFQHHLYYNSSIDIEKTAYQANNHTILIFKDLILKRNKLETSYRLTWHLRYHKPSVAKYINLTIFQPNVYLFCHGSKPLNAEMVSDIQKELIPAPCPFKDGKHLCIWARTSRLLRKDLNLTWPVGVSTHEYFVSVVTLAVTLLCTIYLIFVTGTSKLTKEIIF